MSRFDNGVVQLCQGDARQVLRQLPAESVHCVVTSPPYWGLRDYGLPPLVWGGDDHEHEWGDWSESHDEREATEHGKSRTTDRFYGDESRRFDGNHQKHTAGAFCPCGAWRGSLGLEPTIDLYVQHIVEVFREVWRVMRPDATLWLNMGDSYTSGGRRERDPGQSKLHPAYQGDAYVDGLRPGTPDGLKPKDLCMMPARVALALQADGWWLRSDIVWSKPNPMPESVTDRPTRAHEYLFLLTKAERYSYDADAIREPAIAFGQRGTDSTYEHVPNGGNNDGLGALARRMRAGEHNGRNKRSVWEITTEPMGYEWCQGCGMVYTATEYRRLSAGAARRCTTDLDDSGEDKCGSTRWQALESGRLVCLACEVEYTKSAVDKMPRASKCRHCQKDDAWGSHFATFPQKLVEPCILAGTSVKGVCPDCSEPWERVVESVDTGQRQKMTDGWDTGSGGHGTVHRAGREKGESGVPVTANSTTGWRPTCDCGHEETEPALVLDPFAGSGTVAYVAQRFGRRAIGIDLSADYLVLAEKRMRGQTLPMLLGEL